MFTLNVENANAYFYNTIYNTNNYIIPLIKDIRKIS